MEQELTEERVYPLRDAAKKAGVSYETVRRLVAAGKLQAERKGFGPTCPLFMPESEVKILCKAYKVCSA